MRVVWLCFWLVGFGGYLLDSCAGFVLVVLCLLLCWWFCFVYLLGAGGLVGCLCLRWLVFILIVCFVSGFGLFVFIGCLMVFVIVVLLFTLFAVLCSWFGVCLVCLFLVVMWCCCSDC